MTSNNTQTFETLKNFKDFDNMYKTADRPHRPPMAAAWIVRAIVRDVGDRSRINDMLDWFTGRYFHKKDRQVSTDPGRGFKLITNECGKVIGSITDDESEESEDDEDEDENESESEDEN